MTTDHDTPTDPDEALRVAREAATEIVRLEDVWRDEDVQPNGFERLTLDQHIERDGATIARAFLAQEALLASLREDRDYHAMHATEAEEVLADLRAALAASRSEAERQERLIAGIERTCEQFAFAPTTSTTEEMAQSFLSLIRASRPAAPLGERLSPPEGASE